MTIKFLLFFSKYKNVYILKISSNMICDFNRKTLYIKIKNAISLLLVNHKVIFSDIKCNNLTYTNIL